MNTITKPSTTVAKWLKGLAAASFAAAITAFAPVSQAQSGNLSLSNAANCSTFSGFTWSNGTLSVTCTGSTTTGCNTAAGSFSWAPATGTVAVNAQTTTTIQRIGGCLGAYTLTFGSTNAGASNVNVSPGSVSFADGDTAPKTVTITPSSTTPVNTPVNVTMSGGPITGSATYIVTITAPGGGGGSVPPPGCTTTATYSQRANSGVQFYYGTTEPDSNPPLKPNESIAADFIYQQTASWVQVDVGGVTNPAAGAAADIEVNIDACPGNFTATADSACSKRIGYPSATSTPVYGTVNGKNFGVCNLVSGQKYYVNIRQVVPNYAAGAQPSCNNVNGCALRLKAVNLY